MVLTSESLCSIGRQASWHSDDGSGRRDAQNFEIPYGKKNSFASTVGDAFSFDIWHLTFLICNFQNSVVMREEPDGDFAQKHINHYQPHLVSCDASLEFCVAMRRVLPQVWKWRE